MELAKKRAEAEELERLKREAELAAKEEKKTQIERREREGQLIMSAAIIQTFDYWVLGRIERNKRLQEWRTFIACRNMPNFAQLNEVNAYLEYWRSELEGQLNMKTLLKLAPELLQVVDELKEFLELPADSLNQDKIKALGLMYHDMIVNQQRYMNQCTYNILKDLSDLYDPEVGIFEYLLSIPQITHCLWGNMYQCPEYDGHDFEEVSFQFKIPEDLVTIKGVYRLIKTEYDHYSASCKSYFPPGVSNALKRSIQDWIEVNDPQARQLELELAAPEEKIKGKTKIMKKSKKGKKDKKEGKEKKGKKSKRKESLSTSEADDDDDDERKRKKEEKKAKRKEKEKSLPPAAAQDTTGELSKEKTESAAAEAGINQKEKKDELGADESERDVRKREGESDSDEEAKSEDRGRSPGPKKADTGKDKDKDKKTKGKSKSKERPKTEAELAKARERKEKAEYIPVLHENELNLRMNHILGGTYSLQLLDIPPQPVNRGRWTIHMKEYDCSLKEVIFKPDFSPPPPPDMDASSKKTPEEMEREAKAQEEELQKLILTTLVAPKSALWFEPPIPVRWEPLQRYWSQEGFYDVKFDERSLLTSFRTTKFGIYGLGHNRWLNLPYQTWEIRPLGKNKVFFSLTASMAVMEFIIWEDLVSVSNIDNVTNAEDVQEAMVNKFMRPQALIKALRGHNLDVFPEIDSYAYVDGVLVKNFETEDHLYQCMAVVATAFNFQWSRWNLLAGREKLIFQFRERHGTSSPANYQMCLTTPRKSIRIDCTEVSPNYAETPIEEFEYNADLLNLVKTVGTPEALDVISHANPHHVETVRKILTAVRPLSFS